MAGADAAVAQPAKRQVVARNVDDAVVDGDPTGLDLGQDRLHEPLALTEHVKGERRRAVVHESDRFIQRRVWDDGQYRTENFFLQNLCIWIDVRENRGRHIATLCIHLTTHHALGASGNGVVDQLRDALCMVRRDNALVILVGHSFARVHLHHGLLDGSNKVRLAVSGHQHIIRCNADLTRVRKLGPRHLFGHIPHGLEIIDDDWRLPPQFQRDAARMLRRRLHDNFAHRR